MRCVKYGSVNVPGCLGGQMPQTGQGDLVRLQNFPVPPYVRRQRRDGRELFGVPAHRNDTRRTP
uniref:Uncharacterized protein n=1 Tax=Triticum urartu TaxID=4572 RepID=A0A8R7U008_TRIUA